MGTSQAYTQLEDRSRALASFGESTLLLKACQQALPLVTPEQKTGLEGWIRFFSSRTQSPFHESSTRERIIALETSLEQARNQKPLHYLNPQTGQQQPITVNRLALQMNSDPDERVRKASYHAFEELEHFVLENGFLELIRQRNHLARSRGFENYYDFVVQKTEGLSLEELFSYLDELVEQTEEHASNVLKAFVRKKGSRIRQPWNLRHMLAGDVAWYLDEYLPFSRALPRWLQTFAGLGIDFQGAKLVLDLVERTDKYENGFCIAPEVTWLSQEGHRIPARIHLTSNAVPGQVGSGLRALTTLFHEGGHAAHFANISMNAPCFSQEYAPTSMILAEMQSMFCDSLLKDPDWLMRYGRSSQGESIPPPLLSHMQALQQPMKVLELRSLLVVPYVERALYSMSDEELEPNHVMETVRSIEQRLTLLERSTRPTLAIPHLLSSEASCIYHGYVLAEAAVEQTRSFFLRRDGHLVDNSRIGKELREHCWQYGNSRPFLELIKELTGTPFGLGSLLKTINANVEHVLLDAEFQIQRLSSITPAPRDPAFSMGLSLMHGEETIATYEGQDLQETSEAFAEWLRGQG